MSNQAHRAFLEIFWQANSYDMTCAYCNRAVSRSVDTRSSARATIDHVMPISRGGAQYDLRNTVIACYSCNQRKGRDLWTIRPDVQERIDRVAKIAERQNDTLHQEAREMAVPLSKFTPSGKRISPLNEQEIREMIFRLSDLATTRSHKNWLSKMNLAFEAQCFSDGKHYLTESQVTATSRIIADAEKVCARKSPLIGASSESPSELPGSPKPKEAATPAQNKKFPGAEIIRQKKFKSITDLARYSYPLYEHYRQATASDAELSEQLLAAFEANGARPINSEIFRLAYAARKAKGIKRQRISKKAPAAKVFSRWYSGILAKIGFAAAALGAATFALAHFG